MKNLVISILVISGLFTSRISSAETHPSFPSSFSEFEKVPFAEMKSYPDVKWPADKKVTAKDTEGKTTTELILMKNSIYAQHGFRFSQKGLANYFLGRTWYHPDPESLNVDKLTTLEKANVEIFMKAHANIANGDRAVASGDEAAEAARYTRNMIAHHIFEMGFCTYKVGSDSKAGLIVFDPFGEAKVFHSRASRSPFAPYAYEGYADTITEGDGGASLLIPAKWSIQLTGRTATVLVTFGDDQIAKYRGADGKSLIQSGPRTALAIDLNKADTTFSFVSSHQCQFSIR